MILNFTKPTSVCADSLNYPKCTHNCGHALARHCNAFYAKSLRIASMHNVRMYNVYVCNGLLTCAHSAHSTNGLDRLPLSHNVARVKLYKFVCCKIVIRNYCRLLLQAWPKESEREKESEKERQRWRRECGCFWHLNTDIRFPGIHQPILQLYIFFICC